MALDSLLPFLFLLFLFWGGGEGGSSFFFFLYEQRRPLHAGPWAFGQWHSCRVSAGG